MDCRVRTRERNTLLPVVDKPVTAVTRLSLMDGLTRAIIQPYISNSLIIRVEESFRQLARSARNLTGQDNPPDTDLLRRPRLYAIRLQRLAAMPGSPETRVNAPSFHVSPGTWRMGYDHYLGCSMPTTRLSQVYQYDTQIDASGLLVTSSEKAADRYMDYARQHQPGHTTGSIVKKLECFSPKTGFPSCFAEPQEAVEFLTYKRVL